MPDVRCIRPVAPEQADDPSLTPTDGSHVVSNNNRWSRAVFEFRDLDADVWCELNLQMAWHPEETTRIAHDFAVVGVNFQTEDGSEIDFAYVPGLVRTQIDPHSCYVPGPDYFEPSGEGASAAAFRCSFLVPSPARHLTLTIRSWRNSHPFTISDLRIHLTDRTSADEQIRGATEPKHVSSATWRSWPVLTSTPIWRRYSTIPGHPLLVRGQLINSAANGEEVLARVVFRDAHGHSVEPPYDGVAVSADIGAYIGIPVHRQARRFTIELTPPPRAVAVDLGFQVRRDDASISLVTPLEVATENVLLLESMPEEEAHDAPGFLDGALQRIARPSQIGVPSGELVSSESLLESASLGSLATFHDRLRAVQFGGITAVENGQLVLAGFPPWSLPEHPTWMEDPFQSPAWRLGFQSLSWLLDLAGSPELGGPKRALTLATSWSQANPWGQPKDPLGTYPLSVAVRTEVLLHLLAMDATAKGGVASGGRRVLLAEIIRHGFALSEIAGQNIFSHSVLQIRTACALLALARAIPRFPLSAYWASVALAQLRSGFDHLIAPDGSSIEQSQHYKLELISLGLILVQILENVAGTEEFRQHLSTRLKECLRIVVAMTDPAGMLPPFGDIHHGHHHASWLRRLISGYGRRLLSDSGLAEELSYPTGPRMFTSENAGVMVFRHYERKPDWNYLCASFNGQRHENGHNDCTSFVYATRGVRWITDPGGANLYDTGPARQYLLSSRAHNVAIPDGREQMAGIGWIEADRTFGNGRIVRLGTNVHGPHYKHHRAFLCLDDLSAVAVIDCFRSSQGRVSFKGLLHFDEDVMVALAHSKLAIGMCSKGRLRIIPHLIAGRYNGMDVQSGRDDRVGSLQGFVSHPKGGLRPANTLSYGFGGSDLACGGVILTDSENGYKAILALLASQDIGEILN